MLPVYPLGGESHLSTKKLVGVGVGIIGLLFIHRLRRRKGARRCRRKQIMRSYHLAARDPAYLEDEEEIIRAFDATVGDGLEVGRFPG